MIYKISYQKPHKHFVDIQLYIDNISSDNIYIQLPAWRPGRYELQNFAKNIQRFEITNDKGEKIPVQKISRERWQVNTISISQIIVNYNYYCYQMDAGGCWLDEHQLYLNFIGCAVYVPGRENERCVVQLDIPSDYIIATGLVVTGRELQADSFYHLVDSPVIASPNLQHASYHVQNTIFHLWIQGNLKPAWELMIGDFKKFTTETIQLFGEFPERDYHFLYQILPFPYYHGVEHRNSTVITLGPDTSFTSGEIYKSMLGVSCHELFHAWNALKITPKELTPYDFTQENYFRTGYVIEGVTTYYGDLLLARSQVFNINQYFQEVNDTLQKYFDNFGRYNISVADSSFDLWVDGYVAGIPHRKVSIYGKGAIVALILDLEIRTKTNGEKSLDDVMRYLWNEFGKKKRGYLEEDYKKAVEEVAGSSFSDYFEECIDGTVPIEARLDRALHYAGCELLITPNDSVAERCFGFRSQKQGKKIIIDLLEPNSPADEFLAKDDEIIAIDGISVHNLSIDEIIMDKTTIEVSYIRFGRVCQQIIVADQKNYLNKYKIHRKAYACEEEKIAFQKWLNNPF